MDAMVSGSGVPPWRFFGVYRDPNPSQRNNSWELIKRLCFAYSGPWLCCGDFNEILNALEKLGGMEKSQSRIDKFRRVVNLCQLHDMGFEGDCFTWCGKRGN